MVLAILVFGGGLAYWLGLIVNQRVLLSAGAGVLIAALGLMIHEGGIEWFAIPFLGFTALLVFALKRVDPGFWQWVGWTVFIAVALALGFRATPFFSPVETVQMVEHLYRFPPEKAVLMLLVPVMVLIPWSVYGQGKYSDRPWPVSLAILVGVLFVVTPIALATGFIEPGITDRSTPYLVYWLAYNLIYTCVLEESFFRGIVQTGFIRACSRTLSPIVAQAVGIGGAAILFGIAHFGGGLIYVILATIAGVGYGLAYHLTGRLHCAVLVHFAVNAIQQLAFSGP